MARPSKATAVYNATLAEDNAKARKFLETSVQGAGEAPEAPEYLTEAQKTVYNDIVDGLKESGILGKLDVYPLEATAVAIVAVREINKMIEDNPDLLFDTRIIGTRAKFQTEFWRGCNELCLSPQSRAKLGAVAANAIRKQEDPLIKALSMDD